MSGDRAPAAPIFDAVFQRNFEELLHWRRDVRRFRTTSLEPELVNQLLALADCSPSVGNSQPWRFVLVESESIREDIRREFRRANAAALSKYQGEEAALYARLKLSGLVEAPAHIAVFVDLATEQGHGLGRNTMPEMLSYSVVTAVHTLWLAARIWGLGLGWVSIVDPEVVTRTIGMRESWRLVAYLCIGYPEEEYLDPELERRGWQSRTATQERIFVR
jgi:5,6-dimethylbenzimidazole synthase